MKLDNMGWALMSIIIIELALFFIGGSGVEHTALYDFLLNPSTNSSFYIIVAGAIGVISIAVIASSFFQLNIYAVYAGIAVGALTFLGVLFQLAVFIYGQFSALNQPVAMLIVGLIVFPMMIYYLTTLVGWIRSNT